MQCALQYWLHAHYLWLPLSGLYPGSSVSEDTWVCYFFLCLGINGAVMSCCPSAQEIQLVNERVLKLIKVQAEAGLAQCVEGLRACTWWYPRGGRRELMAPEDLPHPEYWCVWNYWVAVSLHPSSGWVPPSTHLSFVYSLSILFPWPSDTRVWDTEPLVQAQLRQLDDINKGKGGCVLRKQWVVCSLTLF